MEWLAAWPLCMWFGAAPPATTAVAVMLPCAPTCRDCHGVVPGGACYTAHTHFTEQLVVGNTAVPIYLPQYVEAGMCMVRY